MYALPLCGVPVYLLSQRILSSLWSFTRIKHEETAAKCETSRYASRSTDGNWAFEKKFGEIASGNYLSPQLPNQSLRKAQSQSDVGEEEKEISVEPVNSSAFGEFPPHYLILWPMIYLCAIWSSYSAFSHWTPPGCSFGAINKTLAHIHYNVLSVFCAKSHAIPLWLNRISRLAA